MHYPDLVDKYNPQQVLKKKEEKMQSLIDQGKPKYFTASHVDPHIIMKSLGRQLELTDDQKINMLEKTVSRIEKMQKQRFLAAEGVDPAELPALPDIELELSENGDEAEGE